MEAEQILDRAINSYNPSVGVKPITYFKNYVDSKIMRYVNNNAQPVRIVEKHSLNVGKYKDTLAVLGNELGRDPSDDEVLKHMKKTYPNLQDLRLKDIGRLKKDIRTTTFASNTIGRSD
jgi:DNA-directed RNA polymerase sigma subunit (sigma70/sigma32)